METSEGTLGLFTVARAAVIFACVTCVCTCRVISMPPNTVITITECCTTENQFGSSYAKQHWMVREPLVKYSCVTCRQLINMYRHSTYHHICIHNSAVAHLMQVCTIIRHVLRFCVLFIHREERHASSAESGMYSITPPWLEHGATPTQQHV